MRKDYHVTGLALELSTPKSTWWRKKEITDKNPKTLYAHLDESPIYPKSICYLSNVSEVNGPTSFYPSIFKSLNLNYLQDIIGRVVDTVGDHPELKKVYNNNIEQKFECKTFKSHFEMLPDDLKFYSHFGWYVKPDSQIENKMISDEIQLVGKKGSFVVFDGAKIVHRGGLLDSGERIVLQIVFGPKKTLLQKIINKLFY